MSNPALKWLVSWVLATAVATVIATVFVLSVIHTGSGADTALDKTEDIAKLQADVADLRAKLRDLQDAEHRKRDTPEAPADRTPPRTFKIGAPEPDAVGYSVEVRFRDRGIYLVYRDQRIFALRSKCSHCPEAHHTVNWLEAEQKFKCPRCGSGFYVTGQYFEGPARLALERCGIAIAGDGQLEIDVGRTFRKESGQWDRADSFVVPPSDEPDRPARPESERPQAEYELVFDAVRLRAFAVSLKQVLDALRAGDLSPGEPRTEESEVVRLSVLDKQRCAVDVTRIGNIVVDDRDGIAIRVSNVALVKVIVKKRSAPISPAKE